MFILQSDEGFIMIAFEGVNCLSVLNLNGEQTSSKILDASISSCLSIKKLLRMLSCLIA
jgi:hypothetical protein